VGGNRCKEPCAVLCPVYRRPAQARACAESLAATRSDLSTRIYFAVDADDDAEYEGNLIRVPPGPRGMTHATNVAALQLCERYDHLMWVGCDHAFRTPGWDIRFLDAMAELGGWGFVYGNDLLQGENVPTACMISSKIVEVLGWMSPPCLRHLYVDNAWLELGRGIGRIRYLQDVIVEHMHFSVGKSPHDAMYAEVNSNEVHSADRAAFEEYRAGRMGPDIARLRAIAGA